MREEWTGPRDTFLELSVESLEPVEVLIEAEEYFGLAGTERDAVKIENGRRLPPLPPVQRPQGNRWQVAPSLRGLGTDVGPAVGRSKCTRSRPDSTCQGT